MSEITKLYENAGVEQTQDITCGDCEFVNYPEENKPCNACTQYGIKHHPPFTAEKQIELIKWLIQKYKDISVQHQLNLFYINIRDIYTGMVHIEFDETIAGLINNLWQGLTEEEKASIKNILEM